MAKNLWRIHQFHHFIATTTPMAIEHLPFLTLQNADSGPGRAKISILQGWGTIFSQNPIKIRGFQKINSHPWCDIAQATVAAERRWISQWISSPNPLYLETITPPMVSVCMQSNAGLHQNWWKSAQNSTISQYCRSYYYYSRGNKTFRPFILQNDNFGPRRLISPEIDYFGYAWKKMENKSTVLPTFPSQNRM